VLAAARYNFRRLLAWLRLLLLRILIALIHSFTCSWTLGGKPFGSSRSALAQADDRADEILVFARGLEGFAPLAERSRYAIAESRTGVVSEQVLLRPRATVPPSQ